MYMNKPDDRIPMVSDSADVSGDFGILKVSPEGSSCGFDDIRTAVGGKAEAVVDGVEKRLSPERAEALLSVLKVRFEANMNRHRGLDWTKVQAKLEVSPKKMWSLNEMERTGGEPDVVGYDSSVDEYIFNDCSKMSPSGRTGLCYDRKGQRKAEKEGGNPRGNVVDMAEAMGIDILSEDEFMELQILGEFDLGGTVFLETSFAIRISNGVRCGSRDDRNAYVFDLNDDFFSDNTSFRGSLRV
jgi:hypothetical protein